MKAIHTIKKEQQWYLWKQKERFEEIWEGEEATYRKLPFHNINLVRRYQLCVIIEMTQALVYSHWTVFKLKIEISSVGSLKK